MTKIDESAEQLPSMSHIADDEQDAASSARRTGSAGRAFSVRRISSQYGLLVVWAGMAITFALLAPGRFLTTQNIGNIFGSQAVLGIIALSLMIPVVAGEWDLSIGSNVGLSLTLMGALNVNHGLPIWQAALISILAAAIVGAVNAFFVVVADVKSLIATLGMATFLSGLVYAINTTTVTGLDAGFVTFGQEKFLWVQTPFWICLVVAAIVWYALRWTPSGRYLYFVGSSRDVARLAGIRVDRVRAVSLVLSGLGAGVAGVVLAAALGASGPAIGEGFLLPAFAAVFLGSTVLTPGRVNVWGTFIAVYFLMTGISGMQLLGAQSWVQDTFYGAILVVAVALSQLAKRARRRSAVPRKESDTPINEKRNG